jgi:hypothetical protein
MDAPYQIRNWISLYERHNTRDREGPLPWVSLPTAYEGCAFESLIRSAGGIQAFGVFVMLVQMAGRRSRTERGILADSAGPITAERFADKWQVPIEDVERAFALLESNKVGFITPTQSETLPDVKGETPGVHRENAEKRPAGTRGEESRGDERRKEENLPGFTRFWEAWPPHFRKVDKKECLRKWIKNDLEPLTDRIVEDVTRRRNSSNWTKDNGEFVPSPLRYINGTYWESGAGLKTTFQFSNEVRHA